MKRIIDHTGIIILIILIGGILIYENKIALKEAERPYMEREEESTVDGYEDPEETLFYLLYQIQNENLDGALRCCAVSDLAEYFDMGAYLSCVEEFSGTDFIPPSDERGGAYWQVSVSKLAFDYAVQLDRCMEELVRGHTFKVYGIASLEPDEPDGRYYERMDRISTILGARDVCEMMAYGELDGASVELRFSLARYKRYWKVLSFSTLAYYEADKLDIRIVNKEFDEKSIMDLEMMSEDVLPPNYNLISSRGEEDAEELVSNFFLYLQRGDAVSAMTYFDLGLPEGNIPVTVEALERQKKAAEWVQDFYYRVLLYDKNDVAWASRHFQDEPGYLPEKLYVRNMVFVDFDTIELTEETENSCSYTVIYRYDGQRFTNVLTLEYTDQWRITNIEQKFSV